MDSAAPQLPTGGGLLEASPCPAAACAAVPHPVPPPYLGWGELQRVVLQQNALEVPEVPEADRDARDTVAGEVQPHQGQLGQL